MGEGVSVHSGIRMRRNIARSNDGRSKIAAGSGPNRHILCGDDGLHARLQNGQGFVMRNPILVVEEAIISELLVMEKVPV